MVKFTSALEFTFLNEHFIVLISLSFICFGNSFTLSFVYCLGTSPFYTEGYYYVDKTGLIRDLLQNMTYVYASETVWKNHEHGYAETFFETGSDVQYTD